MAGTTTIEWTHAPGFVGGVWNPTTGCTRVSDGCDNCYAFALHDRRYAANLRAAKTLGRHPLSGANWTPTGAREQGVAMPFKATQYDLPFSRVQLLEDRLDVPLRTRKPTCYFVDSMADLFHEDVSDEYLLAVWAAMEAAPQHRYLILTKRPERMRRFLTRGEVGPITRAVPQHSRLTVPGFPDYDVDVDGHVYSMRDGRSRRLSPDVGEQGHSRVTLFRDGERHRVLVHRLILETFDRPATEGEQVRHLNGDATDNRITNLAWGSQSENWADRVVHGNEQSRSQLAWRDVLDIRRAAMKGDSRSAIAASYRISDTQVRNIVSGAQWAPRPRPWIWLGTSIEDQAAADERIPYLLATPAAVRFLSCEPLLGPVDLSGQTGGDPDRRDFLWSLTDNGGRIDWVIIGGESGPRARPMDLAWARSLVQQCKAAGVTRITTATETYFRRELRLRESHGRDMSEWPEDLRVREWPR